MKKAHYAALGNVFSNEVEQALSKARLGPFQSRAKVYRELASGEMPYLREAEVVVGTGPFAVRVKGYELTELGRMAYCMECRDEPEAA